MDNPLTTRAKTVFVVGAGASIDHSGGRFPSIADFFLVAKRLGITAGEKGRHVRAEYEELATSIDVSHRRNILDGRHRINIEQVLTYLEIEHSRTRDSSTLLPRDQLVGLIRRVLTELHSSTSVAQGAYHTLAASLRPADTVLTFNWDLLLDDVMDRPAVLRNRAIPSGRQQQYLNTVLRLTAIGEDTWDHAGIGAPYTDYDDSVGYLLKLHGSIDWVYCSNESCRAYRKVFPVEHYSQGGYCAECHSDVLPLIVPPTFHKDYQRYPLLTRVWNTGVQELRVAKRVVVWGYSLPPTDFHVDWLLRQARDIDAVDVINPSCVAGSGRAQGRYWNRTFLRAYLDIFARRIGKASIGFYEFYSDYVQSIPVAAKYSLGPL